MMLPERRFQAFLTLFSGEKTGIITKYFAKVRIFQKIFVLLQKINFIDFIYDTIHDGLRQYCRSL